VLATSYDSHLSSVVYGLVTHTNKNSSVKTNESAFSFLKKKKAIYQGLFAVYMKQKTFSDVFCLSISFF